MLVPSIPVVFRTALFHCLRRHQWKPQSRCHCFFRRSQPSPHLCASAGFGPWKSSTKESTPMWLGLSSLPRGTDGPRKKGEAIMKEIQETRDRVRERMEEMIKRENIWTIPNLLCVTRICLTPWLSYLVIHGSFEMALGLFVIAGITDLCDGMIARNFRNQQSMLGSFLDPMADKVLVAVLFLSLTYKDLIPLPLTTLIIARDICLMSAGFYIRYRSLPPPRTLSRYFDATHATAQLAPTTISKFNTGVQLLLVACTLGAPIFSFIQHEYLIYLWYITAGTTIASGLSYVFSKETYRILKKGD